jgi:hypothetical protein
MRENEPRGSEFGPRVCPKRDRGSERRRIGVTFARLADAFNAAEIPPPEEE